MYTIEKIKQKPKNPSFYEIHIQEEVLTIHEDTILKYNLLYKKEIDSETYQDLLKSIDLDRIYQKALRYLSIRIRSNYEMESFFKKSGITTQMRKELMKKLVDLGYINDLRYAQSYVHDQMILSNHGPEYIRLQLKKNRVKDQFIEEALMQYNKEIELEKINKYIQKKTTLNKKYTDKLLMIRLKNELLQLGFTKDLVHASLMETDYELEEPIKDQLLEKHYTKAKSKYEKKYEGYALKQHILQYLLARGFEYSVIMDYINQSESN